MPLVTPGPHGQQRYVGEYANDGAADAAITGVGWAIANGMEYLNTTTNKIRVRLSGAWTDSASGTIDHGALSGLADDDHTQYTKADGTRAFTGAVGGVSAAGNNANLATLGDVKSEIQGLSYKSPDPIAATVAALPANTRSGDVLTASANGAFPAQDGVASVLSQEYLVKNEATAANNGIYVLSAIGDGSNPWTLTRRADLAGGSSANGAVVSIDQGTVNGEKTFRCSSDAGSDVVNTDAITWNFWGESVDHGQLLGLSDDDHTQYHNDTRGDARYHVKANSPRLFTNAGNPNGVVTPDKAGDVCFDSTNTLRYMSNSTANTSWVVI